MDERKCPGCGATFKPGTYYCEYCGTDYTPPTEKKGDPISVMAPASVCTNKATGIQKTIFILLMLFCMPISIVYLWIGLPWSRRTKIIWSSVISGLILFSMIMAIIGGRNDMEMDAPKINAGAPPINQRQAAQIKPEDVYRYMRDLETQPLEERQKIWRDQFEGKWVIWGGKITRRSVYTTMPSEVVLKPNNQSPFSIQAYFDPVNNEEVKNLKTGDNVRISGMIWGYSSTGNKILLADGAMLEHIAQKKKEDKKSINPQ